MDTIKKLSMTPVTLRLLLTLLLFGIAALSITGFVLTQQKLSTYAVEVSHKKVDATGSQTSLQTLQTVQKHLLENGETIEKARNIRHSSELPQFKAIEDIRNHADANGISLTDVTFASVNAGSAATPGEPATTPPTTAPPAQADGIDISFTIGGESVNTLAFINFLYDIEHSTPKMQVSGITVAKGTDPSSLKVEKMTIKMFTE